MKIIKKSGTAGLFVIALVAGLIIISCQRTSKKASEKMAENAIENATGKNADVDIDDEKTVIESGGNRIVVDGKANSWPKDIPGDVPEFKSGRIEALTTSSNSDGEKVWSITFTEVQDGFLDKYEAQLKDKGFETTIIKSGDKGGSVIGETNKFAVIVISGEGSATVSVSAKKQE